MVALALLVSAGKEAAEVGVANDRFDQQGQVAAIV